MSGNDNNGDDWDPSVLDIALPPIFPQTVSNGHEVIWDGRVVWVNSGETGMSLGRFSHVGLDVHRTFAEQQAGSSQCLDCSHGGGPDQYAKFCALMLEHYGVTIPEQAMPDYLKVAIAIASQPLAD